MTFPPLFICRLITKPAIQVHESARSIHLKKKKVLKSLLKESTQPDDSLMSQTSQHFTSSERLLIRDKYITSYTVPVKCLDMPTLVHFDYFLYCRTILNSLWTKKKHNSLYFSIESCKM